MSPRNALLALALLVVAAAVALFVWRRADAPSAATAAPGDETPPAGPRAAVPGAPKVTRFRAGARTPVPRFTVAAATASPDAAPVGHPRRLQRGGDGGLTDRRPPHERGDAARLMLELKNRLGEARASIDRCLEEWPAEDPALSSGVMLAVEIDGRGLDEVYFEDIDQIPEGPLACIARSIYPIDWGGLTEKPVKVTWKLRYETDAGP